MVKEVYDLEEIKRRIEGLPPKKKTAVLRKFPYLAMKDEVLEAMTPEEVEEVWQHLEEDPPEEEELAEEIKILRHELELVAKDLGDRFAKLEKAVAERVAVPPLEIERLKRMTEEIEAFRERLAATTMALTYGMPLGMAWKRLYEDRLWAERERRGEVEVTESFVSARNRYEVLHHRPSCESHIRVTPLI